jgi:hypothetical protein
MWVIQTKEKEDILRMKFSIKRLGIAFMVMAICFIGANNKVMAGDSPLPFTIGADLTYTSEYMWRGLHASDGSFQWDYYLTYRGLTASIWNSMDMTDQNDNHGRIIETDYSIDY